ASPSRAATSSPAPPHLCPLTATSLRAAVGTCSATTSSSAAPRATSCAARPWPPVAPKAPGTSTRPPVSTSHCHAHSDHSPHRPTRLLATLPRPRPPVPLPSAVRAAVLGRGDLPARLPHPPGQWHRGERPPHHPLHRGGHLE